MDIKKYMKNQNGWIDRNTILKKQMYGWMDRKKNMKKIDVWLDGFYIHNYLLYITYPFIIHN